MIARVAERKVLYNNSSLIARNWLLSKAKHLYYFAFAGLYFLCGRCTSVLMVNGR